MNSFWRIAAPVACIIAICGAAIAWQTHETKANERLVEDAKVSRMNAEHGDVRAETRLGSMYDLGEGVLRDYSEAMRWFRKAADQGDARAQYDIGYLYERGHGVPQDYAEALSWYRKAAEQREAWAECALGTMYYNGRGVPEDRTEAANWYRKAADQGLARAQYYLGYLYSHGQGVPQDSAEADFWYHKAADQGDEYSQRILGLKGSGLGPWRKISLSAVFLGCLWVLKDPILPGQSLRNRQQRAVTLAGLSGMAYVGLSLYRAFGIFHSVLAVNNFRFAQNLVAGISIAMLISVFPPKIAKFVLGISGVLFIGTDLIVITHHELRHFAATVQGCSVMNGLLLGISLPTAISLWRNRGGLGRALN